MSRRGKASIEGTDSLGYVVAESVVDPLLSALNAAIPIF